MKMLTCAAALLSATLLAGCDPGGGGTPAQPTPGVLTVKLAAPVLGDRALVIAITGPGEVSAVQPAVAGYVTYVRTQGAATRVAVFGTIEAGPVLRFSVPDTRQQYQAAVVDAADGNNTARTNMAAYQLEILR
ncbi:MAG TPA: hypothetical protein VGB15_14365 [Longimicrobium sp.]|jgi:hypothetical protein